MKSSVDTNKKRHPTPTTLVNVRKGKKGQAIQWNGLYVLFDSGASDSFVREKYVKHLKHKFTKKVTDYEVAGGKFTTKKEVKVRFSLPEFCDSKIITGRFKIDSDSTDKGLGYDMIVGRDLLFKLGVELNFKDEVISWDSMSCPMKDYHSNEDKPKPSRKELKAILTPRDEPKSTQEATTRAMRILDSKYEKADLRQIAADATSLDEKQKGQLHELLMEFEELFDGTLGNWKTEPVELELNKGEKPHSSRYYPMPRIHKSTFKKELLRLC